VAIIGNLLNQGLEGILDTSKLIKEGNLHTIDRLRKTT
jgi:hypothetical protein